MDLPESFQTVNSQIGHSIYEQQPDGIRLVMASTVRGGVMKFQNVVPFKIPLTYGGVAMDANYIMHDPSNRKARIFKTYSEAFGSYTSAQLRETDNFVYFEAVQPPRGQKQEYINGTNYTLNTMCIQKDTQRYHTLNYFFLGNSSYNPVQFLAQILMPEQTSNWLDMDRVYQSLRTFRYSR